MAKKIIRGLQDVRTLSGRVDKAAMVYKGYMKLSCLEMEKFRRNKERESAMQRVNNIDARFRDIEREKTTLMQALGLPDDRCTAPARRGDGRSVSSGKQTAGPDAKGFRIKY
jgi:hypothetical protein